MRYLIDGYNLFFALGMAPPAVGRQGLAPARQRLLDDLVLRARAQARSLTVVFDASHGHASSEQSLDYRGIRVIYTFHEQADDRIEELLQEETLPGSLTVVSDDRRLQLAAQRRKCAYLGCLDFYELLQNGLPGDPAKKPSTDPQREEKLSPGEIQAWLEEMGFNGDNEEETW